MKKDDWSAIGVLLLLGGGIVTLALEVYNMGEPRTPAIILPLIGAIILMTTS